MKHTRTCVALGLVGAISVGCEIEERKGVLFGQLCRLDICFAVQRLFLYRIISKYIFNDIDRWFIANIYFSIPCKILLRTFHC